MHWLSLITYIRLMTLGLFILKIIILLPIRVLYKCIHSIPEYMILFNLMTSINKIRPPYLALIINKLPCLYCNFANYIQNKYNHN